MIISSEQINIVITQQMTVLITRFQFIKYLLEMRCKYFDSRKNHIVEVIYRPPNRDIKVFASHLKQIFDKLKSVNQYNQNIVLIIYYFVHLNHLFIYESINFDLFIYS